MNLFNISPNMVILFINENNVESMCLRNKIIGNGSTF